MDALAEHIQNASEKKRLAWLILMNPDFEISFILEVSSIADRMTISLENKIQSISIFETYLKN